VPERLARVLLGQPREPLSRETRQKIALERQRGAQRLRHRRGCRTDHALREGGGGFPQAVFFAGQMLFERDNWVLRMLHDKTALAMQPRLHPRGLQMMILPMMVQA
jgi:hypothetical protein